MTLIQDILRPEMDKIVLNTNPEFNLFFGYCTTKEFIAKLQDARKMQFKYPFFFVNSQTVTYTNDVCTVGEIVIATITKKEFTSEERDAESFKPILIPICEAFLKDMTKGIKNMVMLKEGSITLHYFYGAHGIEGYDGNIFEDYVDAIQLKNFQFRIIQNNTNSCNL